MFPIPPPNRLIDPRLLQPRSPFRTGAGNSPHSLWSDFAEIVYYLGVFAIAIAVAVLAASVASSLSPVLAFVAAPAGFIATLQLKRVPTWLVGLLEIAFFTFLAFEIRVHGPDNYVSDPLWPLIALVAALFIWTTVMMVRRTRA